MKCDRAAMAFDDGSCIGDMVKMTVSEQKKLNWGVGEGLVRPLWSVKKDVSTGGGIEKTVRIEHAAGKHFELIHAKRVLKDMSKFDFLAHLCKFFARR